MWTIVVILPVLCVVGFLWVVGFIASALALPHSTVLTPSRLALAERRLGGPRAWKRAAAPVRGSSGSPSRAGSPPGPELPCE
jgi:hypothetical protein